MPERIKTLVKWSLMLTAIVWTMVFRLSEEASKVPEFVYANF
jgi:hypothetical protein